MSVNAPKLELDESARIIKEAAHAPSSATPSRSASALLAPDAKWVPQLEDLVALRKVCVDFVQLRQFVTLNVDGFRKILKKHLKHTRSADPRLDPSISQRQPFADSKPLEWFCEFAM